MVEPSQFSEVYNSINEVVSQSYSNIEGLCKHTFHIHRFHVHKVKTLNKYLEILTKQKEAINSNLEAIQEAFDTLDSGIVLYLHNIEKVKTELAKLADLQQAELEESKKLYGNDGGLKPIIKTGDPKFTEEMEKIVEYIDRF
jgi:predicted  nucleic acid-binding Zn-ribbon protein